MTVISWRKTLDKIMYFSMTGFSVFESSIMVLQSTVGRYDFLLFLDIPPRTNPSRVYCITIPLKFYISHTVDPEHWGENHFRFHQAPDSETLLTPVFFSSTCFRPSGAAQQLGFLNFTSGSIWKWRLQWRNSGSPIEWSVAHGTLISVLR